MGRARAGLQGAMKCEIMPRITRITILISHKVALDCLSYHASASDGDTDKLAKLEIPTAGNYSLFR